MSAPRRHGWKDASSCRFHHKPCLCPALPLPLTALPEQLQPHSLEDQPLTRMTDQERNLLAQRVGMTILPLCSLLGHQSYYGIKGCCQLPERSKMRQRHSLLPASLPGPAQPEAKLPVVLFVAQIVNSINPSPLYFILLELI